MYFIWFTYTIIWLASELSETFTYNDWIIMTYTQKPFYAFIWLARFMWLCVCLRMEAYLEMFWRNNLSISLSLILFDTRTHTHSHQAYSVNARETIPEIAFVATCRIIIFGVYVMGLLFFDRIYDVCQASEKKQHRRQRRLRSQFITHFISKCEKSKLIVIEKGKTNWKQNKTKTSNSSGVVCLQYDFLMCRLVYGSSVVVVAL